MLTGLKTNKKYSVIIADPPWEYHSPKALVGNGGRGDRGISKIVQVDYRNQYSSMTLDSIKKLKPPASSNCILFLWVTNPFLVNGAGLEVVKAWGFKPKSLITWAKVHAKDGKTPSMKIGHWFRSASEHVIFATRGEPRRPKGFPALPTWFPHERLPHSVKPETIHAYAKAAMPKGPYLEMFARRKVPGWDSWGNEI